LIDGLSLSEIGIKDLADFFEFQCSGGSPNLPLNNGRPDWEMICFAGRAIRRLRKDSVQDVQDALFGLATQHKGDASAIVLSWLLWEFWRQPIEPDTRLIELLLEIHAEGNLSGEAEGGVLAALCAAERRLSEHGNTGELDNRISSVLANRVSPAERARLGSLDVR
jgi:hypothetical protein